MCMLRLIINENQATFTNVTLMFVMSTVLGKFGIHVCVNAVTLPKREIMEQDNAWRISRRRRNWPGSLNAIS